jgi:lysophospholipase L1-like esterase
MPPVTDTSNTSKDTSTKTYLALGDSYTIGQSVPDYERFPVQTVTYLRAKNISIKDADIIAVTGWTTADLLNALNANPPKENYSFVTLLIGVNNQYQGRTLDEYKLQFTELLNRSIAYAGNNKQHVFVLSIPDYSVTPFADGRDTTQIAKEIDEFNDANKTISLNAGVNYIDITAISRNAKNDALLIAKDGLHPSGSQYTKWVDLLAPSMLQQIK